jgi:hypothetical protein
MSITPKSPRAANPWLLGLLAALGVFAWQFATVHANYRGNWTAFFCTAGEGRVPPALEAATYRFTGTPGYDGQFYRLIAHDPFLRKGYHRYLDDPAFRSRRILQPALAWLLVAGHAPWLDLGCFLSLYLCVFLGTASAALYFESRAQPPWWALAFPLLPGVLVCVDRMTVDTALYAALAAALAAAARRRWSLCLLAAACAALSRDLGLLVPAGFALSALTQRHWRRAALFALTTLPTFAWYSWLSAHFPVRPSSASIIPPWAFEHLLTGHWNALFDLTAYPMPPALLWLTHSLDRLVLLAVFAAVLLTLARLRHWPLTPESAIALGFAAVWFLVGSPWFWRDLYSSFRAFTPLLALTALTTTTSRFPFHLLPLAAMTFRFLWQLGPQLYGIVRHWGLLA